MNNKKDKNSIFHNFIKAFQPKKEELLPNIENTVSVEIENEKPTIYFDNYLFDHKINKNVIVVKNNISNTKYIQKFIPEGEYDKNIFDYLYENPIANTPKIISMKRIDGGLVIIKELIDGKTLSKYLVESISLNTSFFYCLLYKLCDILNSLHSAKTPIVHRDIKPENIIISVNEEPYIIDLNSTVFYDPKKSVDSIKLGTEGYAAPEQYGFGSSSPATDIFAMGKLIEHILPFFKNKHLNKKMKSVIEKCCKMDSSDRYKNILELKKELFKREKNYRLFSIPRFRNGNILHIVLAIFVYSFIFYFCFFSKDFNSFTLDLFSFIFIISVIFVALNYLGVYRLMPLSKSKNKFVKFFGIAILTIVFAIIMFFVCSFLYSFL